MPARHRSRQRALQVLFLWDARHQPIDDALEAFYISLASEEEDEPTRLARDEFMEELVRGASKAAESIDQQISAKSEHWRLERMPMVDRNILRLAVYEMDQFRTPPAVVIDEALELARQFSGDDSVSFINGILDAIRRNSAGAS